MSKPFRVLVAGSRACDKIPTGTYFETVFDKLNYYLQYKLPDVVIVNGDCLNSADQYSTEWAEMQDGCKIELYPADWNKYGKKAGPIRNLKMSEKDIDAGIIFWDGKSSGTKNMMDILKRKGIPFKLVRI